MTKLCSEEKTEIINYVLYIALLLSKQGTLCSIKENAASQYPSKENIPFRVMYLL